MIKQMLLYTQYLRLPREYIIWPVGKNLPTITVEEHDLLSLNVV